MTLEEMSIAIENHCGSIVDCNECPLYRIPGIKSCQENCYTLDGDFPVEVARNYTVLFGSPEESNPYWKRITAIAERQREKGMSKYGFGLEMNTADILERINHLQEELIDGLMYCEWIKDKLGEEHE